MSLDTNLTVGWAEESTEETDPITAIDSNYYKFGIHGMSFTLPTEQHEFNQVYFNNRDPAEISLSKVSAMNTVAFWPVNGLWFYYFLGDSSSAAGIHTLSGINSGNLKTITKRWEGRGGTSEKFESVVGNKVKQITFNFSPELPTNPCSMSVHFTGNNLQTAALNSAHNGTSLPSGIADLYTKDSNFSFLWDTAGSSDDYSSALSHFNYTGTNLIQELPILDQEEPEFRFEGNRFHTLSWRMYRGISNVMFEDFKARTLHDLQFKVYQTGSNYLQLDFTDVAIKTMTPPALFKQQKESPYWQVSAIAKLISPKVKDGVADSFYGD